KRSMATSIARASRAASGGSRSASPAGRSPRWSLSLAVLEAVDSALFGRLHPAIGGGRDVLHGAAVAVRECRGVYLLEFDLAIQHLLLPLEQLGMGALELGHHFLGKELQRFADVLMLVAAGLVEQHDLVD